VDANANDAPTTATTGLPLPPTTLFSTNPSKLPIVLPEKSLQTLPHKENPNHFYPLQAMPITAQTTTQQPADDYLELPPATLVTLPSLPVILSRIDRLVNNQRTHHTSLWIPAALNRYHTANRPTEPCLFPALKLAHDTGPYHLPAIRLYQFRHPLAATQQYTPAFDIHLRWRVDRQHYYQHPPCLQTTRVKALAHNRRPP